MGYVVGGILLLLIGVLAGMWAASPHNPNKDEGDYNE